MVLVVLQVSLNENLSASDAFAQAGQKIEAAQEVQAAQDGDTNQSETLLSDNGSSNNIVQSNLEPASSEASRTLPTTAEAAAKSLRKVVKPEVREPVLSTDPFADNLETTLFDVYLGDKFKGAVLADYTEKSLTISDPEVVLEQLKDLKNTDQLLPLLTGTIDKSKDLPGVGTIRYDLNSFRIMLDLKPEFMPVAVLTVNRIAPDPNAGLTLQQKVGVTAAGTVDTNLNSAINHRSIASLGQYFAVVDGAVVSNQPYEITEAKVGGLFGTYRAASGLLQTTGNTFAPSLQFMGVSIETAQELFLDQDLIRGSRFEVFVPSRSRVEFYRDARLIAVQSLDFGLREIDTTPFPQGSYDVDVVITDSFGVVTRERKFFTKAGFLASQNHPIFYFQAGSIRDNLTLIDKAVYQTGVRWRAADVFDLGGSVYGTQELSIGALETNALYRDVRFAANYAMSSSNDAGVGGLIGSSLLGFNFDFSSSRTLRGGTEEAPLPEPDPRDPFAPVFNLKPRRQTLTFQDRLSNSASVYRSIGPFDVRLAHQESSGSGTPKRRQTGPAIEWRILDGSGGSNLRLQGSRFNTDSDVISSVGLLYTYKLAQNWSLSTQVARRQQDIGNEAVFLLALNYDAKKYANSGTRATYRNELQDRRPNTADKVFSVANQLDIDHTGDYLQSIGFIRDTHTRTKNAEADQNTAIGASANASFLVTEDGNIGLSHPVSQEAVFVAEVPSSSTVSEFEVLLNDQIVATVKAGSKAVVGVAPYKQYTIKIRPIQGADLVAYDTKTTTSAFFPGNVIRRVFEVEKVFIVLGRIVDENGQPLANTRIRGPKEYTVTDEDGTFQAEISGKEALKIENKLHNCALEFAIPVNPEFLVQVGDVRCVSQ